MSRARDLIVELLERVMEVQPSFSEEMARTVELQIRHEWGGDRVYIMKSEESLINQRRKRRADQQAGQVKAELAAGASVPQVAQRHGITRRTIYNLLKREPK